MIIRIIRSKDKMNELELIRKESEFEDLINEILLSIGVCKRNENNEIEFLL